MEKKQVFEQEIQQVTRELWQSFRRSILKGDLPRYLFLASKSGQIIGTVPKQKFPRLDSLIRTKVGQGGSDV